jgi:hypothetical protein
LTNKKENEKLNEAVKDNASRDVVSENLELIKIMRSDNIATFFNGLKKYANCKNRSIFLLIPFARNGL